MKDNSFYIPVEMEALPEIKNKIDFYVEEKFDFAHAEKPEEDATLTIKKNDVTIANFRASDKFDTTANITVPTKVSELVNDSEYITKNGIPVKSVDGKTGEVTVDRVVNISESSDSTFMLNVESINSSNHNFESYMIGGTKTLCYINGKIYEDKNFTQEAYFPNTVAVYMLDYMGWAVQLINFSDIMTSQEIKLYKLCKLNLFEISENIGLSNVDSIEFTAIDGSTLIWHSDGEIETL